MEQTNVTLSLPTHIVKAARHAAVERGVSLSRFLAEHLERMLVANRTYEEAKERALAQMREGIPMGVGSRPGWTRDELHER
jgi:uncharacterized protein YwlG (UPF0340 family)